MNESSIAVHKSVLPKFSHLWTSLFGIPSMFLKGYFLEAKNIFV